MPTTAREVNWRNTVAMHYCWKYKFIGINDFSLNDVWDYDGQFFYQGVCSSRLHSYNTMVLNHGKFHYVTFENREKARDTRPSDGARQKSLSHGGRHVSLSSSSITVGKISAEVFLTFCSIIALLSCYFVRLSKFSNFNK